MDQFINHGKFIEPEPDQHKLAYFMPKNLKRISDIATFLESKYNLVIISAVFPYQEAREYLDSICNNVLWVHLFYVDFRERQEFHVKDFDLPYLEARKNCSINTTNFTPEMCVERLLDYMSF